MEEKTSPQFPTKPLFPSYKEMLEEVGRQVNRNKGTFLRRILLLIWPLWILVVLSYLIIWSVGTSSIESAISLPQSQYLLIAFFIWLFFSAIYYFVIGFIFETEKKIWIDSYFDGRNLDSKTSWRIARRLLLPSTKLAILTLFRFYLPAVIFIFVGFAIPYYSLKISGPGQNSAELFVFSNAIAWVVAAIYCYIVHLRLRFLGFLFLDEYNNDTYSYSLLLKKMRKLNLIDTKEMIKRIFVSDFATTSFEATIAVFTTIIESQLQRAGKIGQLAGSLVRVMGDTAAMHAAAFARYAALYILYRYARLLALNEQQRVNEHVYNLGSK